MGALGDALELLATSRSRWRSVRLTLEQDYDPVLGQLAVERAQPTFMIRRVEPPGAPTSKMPTGVRTMATVFASGVDRFRAESTVFKSDSGEGEPPTLEVRNGDSSWQRDNAGTVRVTDHSRGFGSLPSPWTSVLDVRSLTAADDVIHLGDGSVIDRPTIRVRITRGDGPTLMRPGTGGFVMFAGWLGDETDFDLDAATGIALRTESRVDGRPMRTLSVTSFEVDPDLDDALFTEQPPTDAPTHDTHQMAEPIGDIAARVPFTLFAPAGRDARAFVDASSKESPTVRMFLIPDMARMRPGPGPLSPPVMLLESADPAKLPDPADWETVSVSGQPAHLWQAPNQGEVHVRLVRDGTVIWLRGTANRDEALSTAAALEPVALEPIAPNQPGGS